MVGKLGCGDDYPSGNPWRQWRSWVAFSQSHYKRWPHATLKLHWSFCMEFLAHHEEKPFIWHLMSRCKGILAHMGIQMLILGQILRLECTEQFLELSFTCSNLWISTRLQDVHGSWRIWRRSGVSMFAVCTWYDPHVWSGCSLVLATYLVSLLGSASYLFTPTCCWLVVHVLMLWRCMISWSCRHDLGMAMLCSIIHALLCK
jgi:hypothetical protein